MPQVVGSQLPVWGLGWVPSPLAFIWGVNQQIRTSLPPSFASLTPSQVNNKTFKMYKHTQKKDGKSLPGRFNPGYPQDHCCKSFSSVTYFPFFQILSPACSAFTIKTKTTRGVIFKREASGTNMLQSSWGGSGRRACRRMIQKPFSGARLGAANTE